MFLAETCSLIITEYNVVSTNRNIHLHIITEVGVSRRTVIFVVADLQTVLIFMEYVDVKEETLCANQQLQIRRRCANLNL